MENELNPLTLGDTPEGYTEMPDGSIEIPLEALGQEPGEEEDSAEFAENLAAKLSQDLLLSLGSEYAEYARIDKKSRAKRDEQYEEGLRRTGLGKDAPGGAAFEGASRVVHPVLTEACVDFASRAIKELFPPAGPVKSMIVGSHDPKKSDMTQRKVRYMNWQLTTQISEYRNELEQILTQLPMGGSQYQKFYHDPRLARTRTEFAPVDEILLPFAVTDFYSAERMAHRYPISRAEFKARVKSGLYRDIFTSDASTYPDQTIVEEANNKIEGREENGYNEDGLRAVLEFYVFLELEEDSISGGSYAPYIMTIDEDTEQVLSIYRNWAQDDYLLRKLDWFVEWKFIPWRGAYGIGLPHIIGGLSSALTGALRALLDSAHINNMPGLLKLKGARTTGQNKTISATSVTEIDGNGAVDDIRKIVMPVPYNQPSPVLAQLLGELHKLAKGTVASATDQLSQVGDRTPVGTTMALIEQGSAVYSSIHARLHASQKKSLEIIHRLNAQYLDEERQAIELGEVLVTRDDFLGSLDVVPVSDPSIFSEAQRFAQTQAVLQMSQDQTVPWNKLNVYRRALRQMRIENIDELLPETKEPITADFVNENFAVAKGNPIRAALDQDHMTHIQGHLGWVQDPLTQSNPFIAPQALMSMLQHVAEHIRMFQEAAYQAAESMQGEAEKLQVIAQIQPMLTEVLMPHLQMLTQLHQQVQQKMPPPQMPPEVQASIQIAQMDTQRKAQYDQALVQIKQQELQSQQQIAAQELQLKQQPLMFKQQDAAQELQLKQQRMAMDQQLQQQRMSIDQQLQQQRIALETQRSEFDRYIAEQRLALDREVESLKQQVELLKNTHDNEQKQETELLKNQDDNQTKLVIEEMRGNTKSSKER